MKLQHFYSDWNGQKSDTPYHEEPTIAQVLKAQKNNGRLGLPDGSFIFSSKDSTVVEIKQKVGNDISSNLYRDMYRIIK